MRLNTPAAIRRGPPRPRNTSLTRRLREPLWALPELAAAFDPPLLKAEDPAAYKALLDEIIGALQPRDFMEYILAREIADLVWEIIRYKRLKTVIVNEAQVVGGRIEDDPLYPQVLAWEKDDYEHLKKFDAKYGISRPKPKPVEIPKPQPVPLTFAVTAKAFQAKLADYEHLDKMQASAENRRHSLLLSLDYYRRAMVDDVCDAAYDIVDGDQVEAAPLVSHQANSGEADPPPNNGSSQTGHDAVQDDAVISGMEAAQVEPDCDPTPQNKERQEDRQ
jgi:hypothetical protein